MTPPFAGDDSAPTRSVVAKAARRRLWGWILLALAALLLVLTLVLFLAVEPSQSQSVVLDVLDKKASIVSMVLTLIFGAAGLWLQSRSAAGEPSPGEAAQISTRLGHYNARHGPIHDPMPNEDRAPKRVTRRRYLRRVRLEMKQMETIGLVTHADLVLQTRQVYVDVALQPRVVTATVRDAGTSPYPAPADEIVGRRAPLTSFLRAGRVLVVLGAAGSGKTTLARFTALEMAEQRLWPWRREFWRAHRIPVLLYLRDHSEVILADEPPSLARVAAEAPWLRGVVKAGWLQHRLERGRCVVLLDGLDETADAQDRRHVVAWVQEQIRRYPGNSFVLTSRPLGYDGNRLTHADVLQVQRFDKRQIRTFLHAWYRAINRRAYQGVKGEIDRRAAESADNLVDLISARIALLELAANPLLLTMIANVHRYRGQLPGSRVGLYEEMCQVLLHRRRDAKGLIRPDELSGEKKERIVQELAWYMMRHRLRDISVGKACQAIQTVVSRTAPGLTPRAFLEQVHTSGLLVERQHRFYGFAHLTLQEYLAAALVPSHHSRQQTLADNVSDTWWRETTLLWAARADASPIVEACLDAPTATSLHLAYACANEAREIDPALREQLDLCLNSSPADPDTARLLDGVAAARVLHDTHTLPDEDAQICVNPVSTGLWNRYTAQTPTPRPLHGPTPAPAAGLWPADIQAFLTWLNSLFNDGTTYRLPTTTEASRAFAAGLYAQTAAMWTSEGLDVRLTVPAGVPHPHRPTPEHLSAYPDVMLNHLHLPLRLTPRSHLCRRQLLVYTRRRDLTVHDHRLLHALDLLLALDLARTLGLAFARGTSASDFALVMARDLALDLDLDRARDLALVLARVLDFALVLARARALDDDRTLVRDRARMDLDRDLAHALDLARTLVRDLDPALDPARDPDLALARALDRALDRAEGLDLGLALARVTDNDCDLAQAIALDRARFVIRFGDHEPTLDRARDNLNLAHALEFILDRDLDLVLRPTIALARDLAFARALADGDLGSTDTAVVASLCLASDVLAQAAARHAGSIPRLSGRTYGFPRRRNDEVTPFSALFNTLAVGIRKGHPADDPQADLEEAFLIAMSQGQSVKATSMIESALTLASPLWDRHRPVRQGDMALAAACILAVLTEVADSPNDASVLSERLRGILSTLVALTPGVIPDASDATTGHVILMRG
ncbi:NACHT domain-containing protein [Nonomuraea sp. NPDC050663]|uniref:NACHT domain-containing protein n=1 Tax=Nonomuraea sp. NPDC050663 TaxID=3364370 RepID=UPI0037B4CB91